MSDTIRVLFRNQQAIRTVSEDTSLPDVLDYYEEQYGEQRVRMNDYKIEEVPPHPHL